MGLQSSQICGCERPPIPLSCPPPKCVCPCSQCLVFFLGDDCSSNCVTECVGADSGSRCECECAEKCCAKDGPADQARDQIGKLISFLRSKFSLCIPGAQTGPGVVSLRYGNLSVRLCPPVLGPFDPPLQLTYNARAALYAIQFGYGWADLLNPFVESVGTTAALLTDGVGAVKRYTDKDGSGRYLAPPASFSALKAESDGTWTQTRPDGTQLKYASSVLRAEIVSTLCQ